MIRALFEQVATPTKLGPLGLEEVLDWTQNALNRVDRASFFASFEEGQAVQYFYEPFLHAFDPVLRKELGVWYTPSEIVQYMVARVDTVLREELEIEDGLADPQVYVLDPCAGTGSYLVEVLRKISETLKEKGGDALVADDIKRAAMERVFGFEILPAPYVVAHLQLGLLLQNLGAPLSDDGDERVGVYLTNALTGWEPPKEPKTQLVFPELQDESDAASEVKRDRPILVVLGNPPYNAFAGVSPREEQGLVELYKEGLNKPESEGGWGIKKFNLDDLYIRFFRLGERRIAEMTGKGVVCYISNFSYLGDPSFVVMRQRFLSEFEKLWFDCMNGDSRETGKRSPEGKPDPSVFSTEYNKPGIRVGTAVGLMVRGIKKDSSLTVRFRHFWGVTKRTDLLESLKADKFNAQYEVVSLNKSIRLSFRPSKVNQHYLNWPRLIELCAEPPSNGLMEKRGGALIDIDQKSLEERLRIYYDPDVDWHTLNALGTGLTKDAAGFDAKAVRKKVQQSEKFEPNRIRRYAIRPFDIRWCYYSDVSPLWNRARPDLWAQCWENNSFLMSRFKAAKDREGPPFYSVNCLSDDHFLAPDASCFPIRLRTTLLKKGKKDAEHPNLPGVDPIIANLSSTARSYLEKLSCDDPNENTELAALIWLHALAVGYSPAYLAENADGIRDDWPRIPLPDSKEALLVSAQLGRQIADLLDTDRSVSGVTSGKIRPEIKHIGVISREEGGTLKPEGGDLDMTAGWGHADKKGATMPGKGKVIERDYSAAEREAIAEGAKALDLTLEEALQNLGESTCDIYLNEVAYWKNIPLNVWKYTIGGYQVIKKWLSYRERDLLGRSLTTDEAREVMNTARRIAAILLLQPELNANYQTIKGHAYDWPVKS